MPWTNRVRENSGLRILFLPPPPPPTAPRREFTSNNLRLDIFPIPFIPFPPPHPPAPRGESLPAICLCMIDSSTRFNDFFPFLMLRQSGAGQVAQILSGYCGETKANWDWGDVAWQERQRRISLLRSVRGEMPNNSIVFTWNLFYNNFAISRLLIGGGLSSVTMRTMEMTWWWHNLYSSASYVRLSEKL